MTEDTPAIVSQGAWDVRDKIVLFNDNFILAHWFITYHHKFLNIFAYSLNGDRKYHLFN